MNRFQIIKIRNNKRIRKVFGDRLSAAKNRAKKNNLAFELTLEIIYEKYIKQNGRCYYDKHIILTFINGHKYMISIDRIDSNLGYTIENTVLTTVFTNISKGRMTTEEYFLTREEVYIYPINEKPILNG